MKFNSLELKLSGFAVKPPPVKVLNGLNEFMMLFYLLIYINLLTWEQSGKYLGLINSFFTESYNLSFIILL